MRSRTPANARQASSPRAPFLSEMIAAAVRAVCAFARQACARHCQHREAKSTYDTLRELDDRTLHDLGLDRTEVMSIAAELTGQAEHMRLRASDVAPSSDCSSSVMPGAEVAIPATGRTNRVGKVTVHRYETSIPRVVCAFTAVAMAGITNGGPVIVPG